MEEKYDFQTIEEKWQKKWADAKAFEVSETSEKPKFYALEMLPYPSGNLHMGHVRNYSIGDALAWYKRLKCFNVLHPIGWDSFGQPAEDAAIKRGVNPRDWTEQNIAHMRGQLQRLGLSYDWSREIAAHRPDYYKFDQWLFLKLYEMGLAYKKKTQVNWCEYDKAVLSNEQASGGLCWRCERPVTKKDLEQWFLKTTAYADQLLDDMSEIEAGWAEKVLKRQRDWIGKSEGAFVDFKVKDSDKKIRVFTTRIDTIYGANAIVVAAEHAIVAENFAGFSDDTKAIIEKIRADKLKITDYDAEIEKAGVDTNLKAVNPFSGAELPVWVGNYVMIEYGTGTVMSVPAHDERDFEFAKKYDLPFISVIAPKEKSENANEENNACFTEYGVLKNSGDWSGKTSEEAKKAMTDFAVEKGFGEAATTYRLRDWGVSRQRFWGAPIPIVYCDKCGIVPEKYENLPVELPKDIVLEGGSKSPLGNDPNFTDTACPNCGAHAKRETDTMDTFVDSCWYYFRYIDPKNSEMPFSPEKAAYWMPVDQYIGGDDHAVMHLIYTRFWDKAMRDMGLLKGKEFIARLLTQGMVVGETFFDLIPNEDEPESKGKRVYFPPGQVSVKRDEKGKIISAQNAEGVELQTAVERMSKSKGNGVDPDEMVEIYGADAARLFVLFAAPAENELVWKEEGVEGTKRFLQRIWRFVYKWKDKLQNSNSEIGSAEVSGEAKKLRLKTHQTIKRITENFENLQFNTPVAALMELSNAIHDFKIEPETASETDIAVLREAVESLILMLAPFAPHTAEELFAQITDNENGILANEARFPEFIEELTKADEIEIPVQINGKLRSRIYAAPDAPNAELEKLARADEKVLEMTEGKEIVKVIVVPKRLVNIVIKG